FESSTKETLIYGMGDLHLEIMVDRLKRRFGVEVVLSKPHVPYRETIRGKAQGEYRHKKQTGGRGQFGEVHLRIEPKGRGEGFEFVDAVKGGVIPGVFMAAVEKGVRQGLEGGVVAGYAVDDLKVTVFDGKTHAVDGKEVAFVIAGRKAVVEAIRAAKPIVLEPIVNIEIVVPENAIGDLTGDLSSRRGHITGTDGRGHGMAAITGEVPLAELNDYQSRLKSLTGGQGSYTIEFARYAAVPPNVQQQMASKFQLQDDDE
ncbi:MAG: elongation factor G, partial [Betaproteobacteria bacterium]